MQREIAVRGIAVLGGKLLCVRLKPYPGAKVDEYDFWCLPGGGVDAGEPILDAFKREMVEELGVEPKTGRLLYVHQFTSKAKNREVVEFFFHIENPEDYRDVDLSKTTHGEHEIAALAFADPATTHILPEFLSTDDLTNLIAGNEPPKFIVRD
jgi:ADP-ribose pyrophosphatase YjhB (NUDIX family)